VPSLEYEIKPS